MKVLQLTTHMNIGGIANYILSLSTALKREGLETVVASSGGNLEDELEKRGIRHIRLDIDTKSELSPKILKSVFTLTGIVRSQSINIMHAHSRVSQMAASFVSRITGVPYITTCHGFFKKRFRKIFDTWGVRVIAISDQVRAHLKDDLGVAGDRIALIYSGVDIDRFSRAYTTDEISGRKKSLGLKEGPVIGTIGRLSSVKGQKFLIEAMKDVVSRRRDAQCVIVGDGDEEAALKTMAKSLGIEEALHFFKSDLDTNKFLSIMDIFVFPSVKEGLGIALLEALASGRACVASDVGGIRDVIKNGSSGILVPVGDSRAIADVVLRLLGDDLLKKEMALKGRLLVKENFSLGSMAERVAGLYREVVSKKGVGCRV